MDEILRSLNGAFTLAFVVTSMFGLGLGSTVQDLLEPLRNVRLILTAVAINFLLLPALAWAITQAFPLRPDLAIGLILMSAVAGAPLAIKATQIARGDVPAAVSLVVLQVILTVVSLPVTLSLLVPTVTVNAVAVAMPLILQILMPLAAGLFMNVRYDEEADMARPIMTEIANISLALLLIVNLANVREVLQLLGTGALGAALAIVLAGLIAGYFAGGRGPAGRKTLALVSGQRNFAAALVLAQDSFAALPNVFLMLVAASLLNMAVVLTVAGELGRRHRGLEQKSLKKTRPAELPVEGDVR